MKIKMYVTVGGPIVICRLWKTLSNICWKFGGESALMDSGKEEQTVNKGTPNVVSVVKGERG